LIKNCQLITRAASRLRSCLFSSWLSLSYLFVSPTSSLRIPKTQLLFITGMIANILYFSSFCKPTFSGATREWDALYKLNLDKQFNFYCNKIH
jgi:hypothetical protein